MSLSKTAKSQLNIFILIQTSLLLFWSCLEINSNLYFLYDDVATQHIFWFIFNIDSIITNFSIPFINYYQFLGQNYSGVGQTMLFNPFVYISGAIAQDIAGNLIWTYDIFVLINILFSTAGLFLIFRNFKIDYKIIYLCCLIWGTFPFFVIVSKSWAVVSAIFAFLPWNLFFLLNFIKKPSFRNALPLGAIKALAFYSGHPQFVFLMIFSEFIFFFVFHLCDKWNLNFSKILKTVNYRTLFNYFFALITFICISAPQLFSVYTNSKNSTGRSNPISPIILSSSAIDIVGFIKAQVLHVDFFFHNGTTIIYFITPLWLFYIYILIKNKHKDQNSKYIISAIITSVLVILSGTPGVYYLLAHFPIFNVFRWPFKHFIYFLLYLIFFVALISQKKDRKHKWIIIILISSLIFNILIAINYGAEDNNAFAPFHNTNLRYPQIYEQLMTDKYRVLTIGNGEDWKSHLLPSNFPAYMAMNSATYKKVFHFSGYNPLISSTNYHIGLEPQNIIETHSSILDYKLLNSSLLEHISKWSGKYLITYNSKDILDALDSFSQLKMIYNQNDLVIYENSEALPIVRLNSNPKEPVDFKIISNNIEIDLKEPLEEPDKLIIAFAPIEGYSYSTNINPKAVIIDHYRFNKIERPYVIRDEANPINIELEAGIQNIKITYSDKYFIYGLYVTLAWCVAVLIYYKRKFFYKIIRKIKPKKSQ